MHAVYLKLYNLLPQVKQRLILIEKIVTLENVSLVDFLGTGNENINQVAAAFPKSKIVSRGNELKLIGEKKDVSKLTGLIELLLAHYHRYGKVTIDQVETYIHREGAPALNDDEVVLYGAQGKVIKAKSANQQELISAINSNHVVFALGPAGTGKTYLAVALAVRALKNKVIKRIIITRPAVEAGENLGFLPGDLKEKVDPYLTPIYDALSDMIPGEKLNYYKENNIIEIAPLAYMRGRTLNDAYVILDEAQNTTPSQMKMFLTRLGPKSKMIVTGDTSQIDLPRNQHSGLVDASKTLTGIKGIEVVRLAPIDVVRHPIVKKIIQAYSNDNEQQE